MGEVGGSKGYCTSALWKAAYAKENPAAARAGDAVQGSQLVEQVVGPWQVRLGAVRRRTGGPTSGGQSHRQIEQERRADVRPVGDRRAVGGRRLCYSVRGTPP